MKKEQHKPTKRMVFVYTGGPYNCLIVDGYVGPFSDSLKEEVIQTFREGDPGYEIEVIDIWEAEFKLLAAEMKELRRTKRDIQKRIKLFGK